MTLCEPLWVVLLRCCSLWLIMAHCVSFCLTVTHLTHFDSFVDVLDQCVSFWFIVANYSLMWLVLAHCGSFDSLCFIVTYCGLNPPSALGHRGNNLVPIFKPSYFDFTLTYKEVPLGFSQGIFKSGSSQLLYQTGVLKNVAKFTGENLSWSMFLIKNAGVQPATFVFLLKKEALG